MAAFKALKEAGMVKRMLVVATLRICQMTWRQEAKEWTQFKDFKFAFLHGPNKADILKAGMADDTEIFLINYEGLEWLCDQYHGRQLPFDIIVCDEITKLKNYKSVRSKKLRPQSQKTRYKWALTGTPSPNGYMDLFGQWLWLDGGGALGRFITHYRDMFFKQDFNGFDWVLQEGGGQRIEKRIAPYVYRLPYSVKSGLKPNPIYLELDKASRKVYTQVKNNFLAELPEGKITAGNQAAAYSKLSQMANGAVYINNKEDVLVLHDVKLDALDDLIDELQGKPLLVAYEFQHDLARIQERMVKRYGVEAPFLGAGVSGKRAIEIQEAWNNGLIPVLLAHPQSAGHGLNLQKGGACHICWFSATWDLELWEQFIRRIWRQGNKAETVTNHILIVRDTIDELKLAAVDDKGVEQAQLMQAMRRIFGEPQADGVQSEQMETTMNAFTRSNRLPDGPGTTETAQPPQQAQAPQQGFSPKGWGQRAAAPAPENAVDKSAIESRISAPPQSIQQGDEARDAAQREADAPAPSKAFGGFSQGVRQAVGATPAEVEEATVEGRAVEAAERQNMPPAEQKTEAKSNRRTSKGSADKDPAPQAQVAGPAFALNANLATSIADPNAVHISLNFNGTDPVAIRSAMRAFLGE